MMKKQHIRSSIKDKTIVLCGPTCGNCIHSYNGYRCHIFTKWGILPDDPANNCEYHFYRVPKKYMKYYKHKPVAPRGWLWDDQVFSKMMSELWAYLQDLQQGIITDNNGCYFTKWVFGEKIIGSA